MAKGGFSLTSKTYFGEGKTCYNFRRFLEASRFFSRKRLKEGALDGRLAFLEPDAGELINSTVNN